MGPQGAPDVFLELLDCLLDLGGLLEERFGVVGLPLEELVEVLLEFLSNIQRVPWLLLSEEPRWWLLKEELRWTIRCHCCKFGPCRCT